MIINTVSNNALTPVERGGTGVTSLTSGQLVVGNGTDAVTTRAITNNTSTTSAISMDNSIPTMNTLSFALNRVTGIQSPDTNYSGIMMRGISAGTSDLTAGSSALISGTIYLVYE